MPTIQSFNTLRARSYISRLPLFTRFINVVIFLVWLLGVQSVWDVRQWGTLYPAEINFATAHRLTTFPLIHSNFFHMLLNVIALTPLMERTECEYGTLTTFALFFGPLTTIPGVLYIIVDWVILRANTGILGASIWVFLLLGMEAIRTYKSNPHLVIATHQIPTWTIPLLLVIVVAALVPGTSLLGHLCGLLVGYVAGLGYVKFLAPPEWALRWVESRLNLLALLPHYVSVDQKTYGRPTAKVVSSAKMPRLLSSAMSLRRDPRILKLPPYLSFAFVLVGIAWLLLLPLDNYCRRTYISENALLPGQVHTYFGGSEHHVLRAYRQEVNDAVGKSNIEINDKIEDILKGLGVKVGRQSYTYHAAGKEYSGENVYGILQAPRGDATEAIVLVAPWESIEKLPNRNGVALALTMARYFKRWSLWSKDIIILFPPDSRTGTQAWVDAYHDAHNPQYVTPLPLKSGALQGALALDFPLEQRFSALQVIYDGVNGQLPNLDLVNSVGNIASGQMGIHSFIQSNRGHNGKYKHRLKTMLRGMLKQGVGYGAGAHSSFIPYHVDAVTVQPFGKGPHDEMAMGRVIEGSFRSLNNLLEHLHQSFFFYLLMQRDRFVSIGTYLPSAMLLAANFSIMAISLWVKSGQSAESKGGKEGEEEKKKKKKVKSSPVASPPSSERSIASPAAVVLACHALAAIPLSLFNHLPADALFPAFIVFSVVSTVLPFIIANVLGSVYSFDTQSYQLMKSFSLLILGVALSTLATLNFSLAFIIGVVTAPLSFVHPVKNQALKWVLGALLCVIAPPTVIYGASSWAGLDVTYILEEASFGWHVWGMYTPIVVWGIWWPAWTLGMVSALGTS